MKLIVGLGNPGEKYAQTRHNIGFMVLDHLLKDVLPVEKTEWKREGKSLVKEINLEDEKVLLVKPRTYMNLSGEAVGELIKKYDLKLENIFIIYDEIDLPFGQIKVRFGGGSAGHKGVESLIANLQTDKFLRIRIGVGHPAKIRNSKFKIQNSVKDYILEEFESHEKGELRHIIKQAIHTVHLLIKEGTDIFMSKYNKKQASTD